jgi:iron complex transport system substrate-binding protein
MGMKLKAFVSCASLCLALSFAPLGGAPLMAGTGTDSRGVKVSAPGAGVRIVSLSPGATETLYAIGAGDEVVGVSDFCDYPPSFVAAKPRMGGFSTPNIEKIQAARPHVVMLTTVVPINIKNQFDRLGIQMFVAEPDSFNDLLELIVQLGVLTGRRNEALAVARGMSDEAGRYVCRIRAKSAAPVKTIIELWHNPLYMAEKGSLPGDIVTLAGGRVIPDTGNPYSRIDEEKLLELDPEAIVLGHQADLAAFLETHKNVAGVHAIRNNKIFAQNPDKLLRPGPRVVDALREIAQFLHPEAF